MPTIQALITTFIGIALITLTLGDLFITVLHPEAEGPLSSRLQKSIWYIMRYLARGLRGRARHRFIGLGVPIMIVALVAVWVLALLFGYGLIYAAWISIPGAFHAPVPANQLGWGDAMYFSGVTLVTTGYGDFQPLDPLLRVASVIEGFSGVGVLSLSVAYVLEVYPVLQRTRVLAVLLNEETAGQVHGLPMLSRYLRTGNFAALAGLLRTINLEILFLAEAHRRLPILHYSHPTDPERSFLRVLLVVQNVVAAIRFGFSRPEERNWSDDPRVQDLEDSFFYTLHTLGSSFHLPLTISESDDQRVAELRATFEEMRRRLGALKLHASDGANNAALGEPARELALYIQFYTAGDTSLRSYLRNSAYSYQEATQSAARPQRLIVELEEEAQAAQSAQDRHD